jgi:hypothetical protein
VHGVTSHYTVHIYQIARSHIPQHSTYLPNYTVSHPSTHYVSTKLHGVTSHSTLHIYQNARRHITQHCAYLPNCTDPTTLHISIKLHGVTSHNTTYLRNCMASSHNTVHIYQTTRFHITQCCTYLPNYTVSHPTTMYISTKLHGVTSHNAAHIYQTTRRHGSTHS